MKPGSRIRVIRVMIDSSGHACSQGRVTGGTTRRSKIADNTHKQGPIMITEIAQIDVKPGAEVEFEKGSEASGPDFQARQRLPKHGTAPLDRKADPLSLVHRGF